jgi:hypothetical protein
MQVLKLDSVSKDLYIKLKVMLPNSRFSVSYTILSDIIKDLDFNQTRYLG